MARRKLGVFVGVALAAVAALAGCEKKAGSGGTTAGGGAGAGGGQEANKSYVIGMIAKSQNNPVFLAARTGAEDAARELGAARGIDVRIDWRTPTSEDAQKQAQFLDQMVANGVDGVALSASDAGKLVLSIDNAVAKGVPVVCFDSDVPQSKRFAYFGTDDEDCGRRIAQEMVEALGGEGTVAVLAGNQTAPNLQSRVRGVREELANHADVHLLDVYYHVETPQDAVAKMEQVQGANPQVSGWILVGGWPLNADNALDKIAPHAKVVSVDALRPMLVYVENGQVQTLLAQQVYEWGYESVRLLLDKIIDNKAPADPMVRAPLVRVTSENAAEYGENWAKWLGEKK